MLKKQFLYSLAFLLWNEKMFIVNKLFNFLQQEISDRIVIMKLVKEHYS